MKEFLLNYGWSVGAGVVAAAYFYVIYKKRGKEAAIKEAKIIAYKLMIAAEKKFGQGAGRDKFNYVVDRFYLMLPESFKIFISEDEVEKFIQETYDMFKFEVGKK